jgi:hypothetical protein
MDKNTVNNTAAMFYSGSKTMASDDFPVATISQ